MSVAVAMLVEVEPVAVSADVSAIALAAAVGGALSKRSQRLVAHRRLETAAPSAHYAVSLQYETMFTRAE